MRGFRYSNRRGSWLTELVLIRSRSLAMETSVSKGTREYGCELRQAPDAAALSDLASDLDGERRDAVEHVIDQFRSTDAVVRLPN